MINKNKNNYEAPATEVVRVKIERNLCQSNYQSSSSVKNYTWHEDYVDE